MNAQTSILPIGKVNLKTGKNRLFNVYDTWKSGTAEIHRTNTGKTVVIFTSGNVSCAKLGESVWCHHDQTRRWLFDSRMVDSCPIGDLPLMTADLGTSVSFYVYK